MTSPDESPREEPSGLGAMLRAHRERALLTQEELAERSGISVGAIAGIESGRTRRPRSGSLRLLAEALGLTDPERAALSTAARGGEPGSTTPGGAAPEGTTPAGTPTTGVPAQLPPDLATFAGRAEHLKQLDDLLPGDPGAAPTTVVISALAGTAGIGKTTLAVHWAHRVTDRFPDGQLYANLRGFGAGSPLDSMAVVRGFLDALGVPPDRVPASPEGQVGLYRSLLAGRRVLIVLDNARDSEQVRPLLPGSGGCLVVVTSRNQLSGLVAGEGAHPLTLDVLSWEEARQLLRQRLAAQRVTAEPDAADQIIAGCTRLPLALAIVAARAAAYPDFSLHAFARELRDAAGGLDAFAGGDASVDLRTVFSWSYQHLSPDAARLFRLLGLIPGPDLGTAAAASLAATTPGRVRAALAELTRAHLVSEHAPGRYLQHDLLQAYAAELSTSVDGDQERRDAQGRLLDHCLHTAYAAARLIQHRDPIELAPPTPGTRPEAMTDRTAALAWLRAEQRALLAAVELAAGVGFDRHAWQLAWSLVSFLTYQGQWHDAARTQRAALTAATRLGDLAAQAWVRRQLGGSYLYLHRFDDARAELHTALDLCRHIGDQIGQAQTHRTLSVLWNRCDDPARALEHAERACETFLAIDHRAGYGRALNDASWCQALLGDYEASLVHGRQAVAVLREVGDPVSEATAWDSLGFANHHLGRHQEAIECYQQALERFRELGIRYEQADVLTHLGDTHQAAGDQDAARRAWLRALGILEELDHPAAGELRARLDG